MGRHKLPPELGFPKIVRTRVTKEELAVIDTAAAHAGLTRSNYVREAMAAAIKDLGEKE